MKKMSKSKNVAKEENSLNLLEMKILEEYDKSKDASAEPKNNKDKKSKNNAFDE